MTSAHSETSGLLRASVTTNGVDAAPKPFYGDRPWAVNMFLRFPAQARSLISKGESYRKSGPMRERKGAPSPFARGASKGPSAIDIFLRLLQAMTREQSCLIVCRSPVFIVGRSGHHSRRPEMYAIFQRSATLRVWRMHAPGRHAS